MKIIKTVEDCLNGTEWLSLVTTENELCETLEEGMERTIFINGKHIDCDNFRFDEYYLKLYRNFHETYVFRIDKIHEIKIYINYGRDIWYAKKYDFSLWVKNSEGVYEEFARAKSNDARYIYNKLVKSQYDKNMNLIPIFKDKKYINNYNHKQSYCLTVDRYRLEWHED